MIDIEMIKSNVSSLSEKLSSLKVNSVNGSWNSYR